MSLFIQKLANLLPNIMADPSLYLHTLDIQKGQGLIVQVDREFYKEAIFLDQRCLQEGNEGAWVPLNVLFPHVHNGAGERKAPVNFIFHGGHSGSTLISRLLDEIPSVLGLREPLPLRTLAIGQSIKETMPKGAFEGILTPVYQLLARRFSPESQVIIKATSMTNNLGPDLLKQNPANRALLLFVKAETFLANILDKREVQDMREFFPHRIKTFQNLFPGFEISPDDLSRGEAVAFNWLVEVSHLNQMASGPIGPRALKMDFDQFLNQRDVHLDLIVNHFDLPGGGETLGRLLASSVFKGYAKQPDFNFTPAHRLAVLNESRNENKIEIEKGLAFIKRMGEVHHTLAEVFKNFPTGA